MAKKVKLSDAEQVTQYMEDLSHPLKPEIETLRNIIKGADSKINERIKWNAPSYYYKEDIVTFGPRKDDKVLLVFHHPHVVNIKSDILEGDFKDRRLVWLGNMAAVKRHKKEIAGIIKEIITEIDRKG